MKSGLITIAAAFCAAGLVAFPAMGEVSRLGMLDGLQPGLWAMRERNASTDERICISSGSDFVQLRHQGKPCNQVVVSNKPNEVTVQYTCPGQGYGRTTVRKETGGLIQLDTQGISAGRPFVYAAEGRRIGSCVR